MFFIEKQEWQFHRNKGTYHLSNLLQELVLAMDTGEEIVEIPLSKIEELPHPPYLADDSGLLLEWPYP